MPKERSEEHSVGLRGTAMKRPRNLWSRLGAATDYLADGDLAAARMAIEGVRYHPALAPDVLQIWQQHLAEAEYLRGGPSPVNLPSEYLANRHNLFRAPFRKLDAAKAVPKPYPWAMALPGYAGSGNSWDFLAEVATALEAGLARLPFRLHVVWAPDPAATPQASAQALATVINGLADQVAAPRLSLTICGGLLPPGDLPFPVDLLAVSPLHPSATEPLRRSVAKSDLMLFLTGAVELDPMALARLVRLARVSEKVVQPLVPMSAGMPEEGKGQMVSPFTPELSGRSFVSRYPFREIRGCNLAISSRLLEDMDAGRGGPVFDPRFAGLGPAARELAFRAYGRGVWFAPLRVPSVAESAAAPSPEDHELFKSLCPNHWDRKRDVWHEVPKVSVYIPAYNASKYIERAVDSVLSQDVADLDVCIANDGSRDGTLALLERLYSGEKRVRWIDNPNGGIGFASNSAIRMSDSLYIGQLDSDDCLKPGAVRRLMGVLDENPKVVCAYGSCERIDAAGNFTQNEYAWPVFTREKMMITSIAHHFRMFRRQTWERTSRFREDIVNGVDYDIFLKMSEVGEFQHVEETLYQRRWHGENTSHVNEHHQTTNTHRVQREALARQGLSRFWDVHVPDPEKPRNVSYRRNGDAPMVVFWPDYSRGNPYQRLLYAKSSEKAEFVAGDIDAALKAVSTGSVRPGDVTFHLHWLNALFRGVQTEAAAQQIAADFGDKLVRFRAKGGRVLWTLHNTISHDTPFAEIETALSTRVAAIADRIHIHSDGAEAEVSEVFLLPAEKVRVSRHGHYIGAYSDIVSREAARQYLGLSPEDDVILFTGMVRPYKGVEDLVRAFRAILADRPQARLVIAGLEWFDPLADLTPALTEAERARILTSGRFIENDELQLFFRAADIAAYPYLRTLTSGSLLLALSFGVPTVIPRNAMTVDVLQGQGAGMLYDNAPEVAVPALEDALRQLLAEKDAGNLPAIAARARARAQSLDWPDFTELLV